MEYKVKFSGKSYDLPARTLSVDEQMEGLRDLDADYSARKLSRRECVEKMHAFAEAMIPGALPPLDEVDTNQLSNLCAEICAVYAAPVQKARADIRAAELREELNRPEVQKLLAALRDLPKQ